jgi:ArsR family transcriptional regulator
VHTTLETLKALSDRNRLRVVAALLQMDELCACQIVELLHVTGATASRHMSLLIHAGIVESRKQGRWVYYSLKTAWVDSSPLSDWLAAEFRADPELQADQKFLQEIVACEPEELCRQQRGEACCPITHH